jgi:hypothetical protein
LSAATTVPLLVSLTLSSCVLAPPLYWAEAIHARVIDADTGAPVQGAVVVADWKLYGGGIGHGGHRESLFVEETATDASGEFTFGKWGPKKRPAYAALDTAPWLVVFKRGYQHRFLPNAADSNASVRRSDWDGRTVELRRFSGTPEERIRALLLVLSISEQQPRALREILAEQGAYPSWPGEGPAFFEHVRALLERGNHG